ncbi:MAG: zinc carboxypeptidase, partial [Flavobacteriaceae bacterium]|nr:zinc carboxypeptidase [Bacteroidia bacterium]NNL60244.1 zinc carboxypeptidase [Flavobacteriaceae bacterium]
NMRVKILDYQRSFFSNARNEASRQGNKAIVFGSEKDAARTFHLAEILKRHKITIHEVSRDFSTNGKNFKKGYSYVVPKNQRNTRLINAMFDVRTTFTDSLFYDVSAWTFNHAFNVDFAETTTSNAGAEIADLQPKSGGTERSNYAYLMEWHEYYTPKILYQILNRGLRAKVAMKKFNLNGKQYDYGTILIPVQNQKKDAQTLHTLLDNLAKESHVKLDAVGTGLTPQGIDLGSNNFRALKMPKVALLVGNGIRSYDAGEIWHLFDQRFNITVTKLDTKSISRADLSRYTTIIVPSTSRLGDSETKKIEKWVNEGGTLIAYRSAVNWLKNKKLLEFETKKSDIKAKNVTFEQRGDFNGAQVIGGAIFEAEIDRSHPINFGYTNDKIALFRNNTIFIKPDKDSYDNPIKYTKNPLLSGYISKPKLDSLAGTVPFKVGRKGSGRVIAFTDNTNFRAFWYGTNKLLMNAIFFARQM